MREIKLSNVDLQVFYHIQNLFEDRYTVDKKSFVRRYSIDIKDGLVQFLRWRKDLAFQYKTQSDFKDFVFPNIKEFSEMLSLCGANSKIFIDDNHRLTIQSKNKKSEFNFNESDSLNVINPNTHHIKARLFNKEEDDICFNISSLDFEDIRQRYRNYDKISKIKYIHLFTNIASEIVIAFERDEYRHTYFHNTFIKSNKDFYLVLDRSAHPFKYLLRDNYEVRIRTHGENLDAIISFYNLSIPLITVIACKVKEKNYCPLGDFNEVVTGFEQIQKEPKIANTPKPDSTELKELEKFTK